MGLFQYLKLVKGHDCMCNIIEIYIYIIIFPVYSNILLVYPSISNISYIIIFPKEANHIHLYMSKHVYIYIYTYVHTYIHTHIYIIIPHIFTSFHQPWPCHPRRRWFRPSPPSPSRPTGRPGGAPRRPPCSRRGRGRSPRCLGVNPRGIVVGPRKWTENAGKIGKSQGKMGNMWRKPRKTMEN